MSSSSVWPYIVIAILAVAVVVLGAILLRQWALRRDASHAGQSYSDRLRESAGENIGFILKTTNIIAGLIAIGIVGSVVGLTLSGTPVPQDLSNWGGVVLGFYFGQFISLLKDYITVVYQAPDTSDRRSNASPPGGPPSGPSGTAGPTAKPAPAPGSPAPEPPAQVPPGQATPTQAE
jgi:hypothetical protein